MSNYEFTLEAKLASIRENQKAWQERMKEKGVDVVYKPMKKRKVIERIMDFKDTTVQSFKTNHWLQSLL